MLVLDGSGMMGTMTGMNGSSFAEAIGAWIWIVPVGIIGIILFVGMVYGILLAIKTRLSKFKTGLLNQQRIEAQSKEMAEQERRRAIDAESASMKAKAEQDIQAAQIARDREVALNKGKDEISRLQKELESIKKELAEEHLQNSELSINIRMLNARLESESKMLEQATRSFTEAKSDAQRLEGENRSLRDRLKAKEIEITDAVNRVVFLESEIKKRTTGTGTTAVSSTHRRTQG